LRLLPCNDRKIPCVNFSGKNIPFFLLRYSSRANVETTLARLR
jgi:hypothetical protein